MLESYKWIGMGRKSLKGVILRAPLCGANKQYVFFLFVTCHVKTESFVFCTSVATSLGPIAWPSIRIFRPSKTSKYVIKSKCHNNNWCFFSAKLILGPCCFTRRQDCISLHDQYLCFQGFHGWIWTGAGQNPIDWWGYGQSRKSRRRRRTPVRNLFVCCSISINLSQQGRWQGRVS